MSDSFSVKSSVRNYQVNFIDNYAAVLSEQLLEGDVILLDQNVYDSRKAELDPLLTPQNHRLITPSESLKEYHKLEPIIEFLIETGFRKNHRLIAIGGGIIQDITAFISSILYRGVDWYFFPTTLLAQCDSCIGGKSSINFGAYKNQLGNFNPPNEIFIDHSFLKSLSDLDIRSGLGEMMHFYYIAGEKDFNFISENYDVALNDYEVLGKLIQRNLQIKKATIEIDEFDKKERLVFNYGHSFGHAIESLTDYRIPHGIAVCTGMDLANWISSKLGLISEAEYEHMHSLIVKNVGEIRPGSIDLLKYESALRKDKKNIGSQVNVILTRGLGKMFKSPLEIDDNTRGWIKDFFSNLQQWPVIK